MSDSDHLSGIGVEGKVHLSTSAFSDKLSTNPLEYGYKISIQPDHSILRKYGLKTQFLLTLFASRRRTSRIVLLRTIDVDLLGFNNPYIWRCQRWGSTIHPSIWIVRSQRSIEGCRLVGGPRESSVTNRGEFPVLIGARTIGVTTWTVPRWLRVLVHGEVELSLLL